MILHCIRHGVTASNLAHRFNDSEDEPLADGQVELIRETAIDTALYDRIYVSPLRRCLQTAGALGLESWVVEPRIAERGLGIFQGWTGDECAERFPEDFKAFQAFDADFAIPGGESRAQHLSRIMDWLEEVAGAARGPVLAVTHGGVVDFLFRAASGRSMHGGDGLFGSENLTRTSVEIVWPHLQLLEFSQALAARATLSPEGP